MTGRRRKPPDERPQSLGARPADPEQAPSPGKRRITDQPSSSEQRTEIRAPEVRDEALLGRSRDVVPGRARRWRKPPSTGATAADAPAGGPTTGRARRWWVLAALCLVLVLIGVAASQLLKARDPAADERGSAGASARPRTLLVQVVSPTGTALSSALLAVEADGRRAAMLLIPSRLVVDLTGTALVPFGDISRPGSPTKPGTALSTLLRVRVDGTWTLTPAALAALVDRVGGVQAEVDVDVLAERGKQGQRLVVAAGPQELAGAEAAAYATYSAEGEPELAKLARFNEVLTAVLRSLPSDRSELAVALTTVANDARTTLPGRQLEQTVDALRRAVAHNKLFTDLLPVNDIVAEGRPTAYGIDAARADDVLRSRFRPALKRPRADDVRVLVQDGIGAPALVEQARTKLVGAGFRFVHGGSSTGFGSTETLIFIPESTPQGEQRGAKVAAVLGVPAGSIRTTKERQLIAEVVVVLGSDFNA